MDFIKKRLMLISCLGVVLLGIVLFIPAFMVNAENVDEKKKLKTEYDNVQRFQNNIIHDNEQAQSETNVELAVKDAEYVTTLAKETSHRPLIFDEVFPKLKEQTNAKLYYQKFSRNYCQIIDQYLQQLNAGDRPSEREEDDIRNEQLDEDALARGLGNAGRSRGRGWADADSPVTKLINAFRRQRAEKISIYANTGVFFGFEHWKGEPTGDQETMLMDSWFTQLAAWIQEDVVFTIKQVNADSGSVFDSTVKRLVEISFGGSSLAGRVLAGRPGQNTKARRSNAGGVADIREDMRRTKTPVYVIATRDSKGEIVSSFGEMCIPYQDRASCDLVDVAHFELAVVIDAIRIHDFINALQSEKFNLVTGPDGVSDKQNIRNQITVLQIVVEPIDIQAEQDAGYYYGTGVFKVLRLNCEYIFFKTGYEEFKPEPVQKLFEVEEKQPKRGRGRGSSRSRKKKNKKDD